MRADQEYQEKRNELIRQVKEDVLSVHATRQFDRAGETYYTRHTLLHPGTDPSKAAAARATWQYDRNPPYEDSGRLTTLFPERYETDEDKETLSEIERRKQNSEQGKKR